MINEPDSHEPQVPGGAVGGPNEVTSCRYRQAQLVPQRAPAPDAFTRERQKQFLALFAATCNVRWAARSTGISQSTAYRQRMINPAFAAAWDMALEQGYARLEMRILQQQFARVDEELDRIDFEGDWDVPDPPVEDMDRAVQLLKHHHDRVTKIRAARAGAAEPPPEIADDATVVQALAARLATFGREVRAEPEDHRAQPHG